jgi:hypothetical protein
MSFSLNNVPEEFLDCCGTYDHRVVRRSLFEEWGNRCGYCGKDANTLDHIVPRDHGGISEKINLLPCCGNCNIKKGSKPVEDWYRQQSSFSRDRWERIQMWRGLEPFPETIAEIIEDCSKQT